MDRPLNSARTGDRRAGELTRRAAGDAAGRAAPAGRVLIVDDRPEKLLAIQTALAPLGHEIVKAGSGREALRCLL